MKKYIMMALLLCCGIGAWADNNITLSDVQGAAGTEVTVSVSMTNTDAVSALQLSIPLDDNLTFVENSQQAGSRIEGHTLSAGVKDGVLNVMVYSSTMATISGNEGEVCSFKLQLGYNPGTINLTPSKTSLTGADGSSLTATAIAGSVETQGAKIQIRNNTLNFGKTGINELSTQYFSFENVGNESLTITDISFSSAIFSISEQLPKTINANSSGYLYVYCKPTARGNLDEEMTIVSNSVTGNNTIRLTAIPYGVNELRLGNASGSTDEEVTIPVSLKNYDDISGLQMEIKLPKELEYVDGSFELSERKQDHVCSASLTDDILSIVAYSPSDKPFTGSEGEIGSFKVKIVGSNNANLNFEKAMLSSVVDGKTTDVLSSKNGCTVSVKSPNMYTNSSLDFGRISINEQDAQKTLNIRNRGSAPLVISNIAFTNGKFNVKEELPLTIDASSSKNITVICKAKEEGDIGTSMEIYTNDPNKRLYIVDITGEIFTPDYLATAVDAKPDKVILDISLNNYSDIYGIQFDIVTTQDFTASANDVILTERSQNLSVSINSVSEGKLRVVAYAKNNQFISTGEGKVMTIKMVPNESLGSGEHSITLSNIMLSSKGMKNIYAGKDVIINFGVGDPVTITAKSYTRVYGDANPTFEYTAEGATVTGTPEITCVATATSPIGTYPIVIKKGTVTNYNDTYVNGTLTITKAPLSVKAGTYTRKQGEDNPEFTLSYEGFKNNETEAVLTKKPTATTTATKESALGEYEVKVSGGEATNYEFAYTNGKLIVTDADAVIVTAKSYTRTYGDANPTFEFTSSGATLVGVPEITCEATATSPVGTYPIVIKKGTVTNYNDTYVNGTLTITKAPLSVKAGTYTRKQGEDNPEFTLSYEGFKNNETEAVLTKKPTATTTATKESALGEYEVKVSGGEATNYEFAYTNGKLIVTDADAVIVTAKSYTRTYGDANPTFEFTSSGASLVGVPEITCEATATSPVGTYPIVIKKGTVTNYNDTYVNGTLTITKAPLSVKAGTYTRKQGEDNPEFTLSYEGFKNNETEAVLTKKPTATTTATKESALGEYEVKVSGGEAANYEFAYTNGKLIVTDADAVIVTAKSYTRTYGDANPTFEFTSSGATLVGVPEITCEATATSPVGTYPIVIKKGTVTNYNDTYVNGTLTITKAPLSVKAGTYTRKQGEDNPEFTLSYEGFKNNETEAVLTKKPTATTTATKESALGEYEVTVSGGEATNYEFAYTNGKLIVTDADAVIVTAKSYTRTYGDANPTFEFTSSGATLVGVPEITCEATATSPVGTYPIVIKKGTVTNYNDTYVNGTLTITKAPLSVKAGTYTRKQGEDNPEFTLSYEGFKNNETEAVLTKKPTATTTATKESALGEYEVKVSGGEATNYEFTYTNGKLIVTDADAVVVTAKSYTRTYGDANPTFEFTSSGATLVGVPEITCEATATSPVGTYPIVIKKGTVTNYNDTYVNGTLTITKAPLTVKVENVTREQYVENPEFVITYTGWKVGDDESVLTKKPTATTTATQDSPVGEYAIVVSGGEAQNYEFSYQNGVLTVTTSTGIYEISIARPVDVYNMQGNKVRTKATTLEGLPQGVYIVNGRKVLIK